MNIKDFVVPLTFAIAITLAIQYFFGSRVQDVNQNVAGQRVEAPQTTQAFEPLNVEVSFNDQKPLPEQITEVDTSYGHLEFSSIGGCLKQMTYHRTVDGKSLELTTITPPAEYEKFKNCFLVALDENTPYFYKLIDQKDSDQTTQITYQVDATQATIIKVFTVHKNKNQIDLDVTIKPSNSVRPRIIFPSPLLIGSTKAEHVAGIIEERDAKITKYFLSRARRTLQDSYWQMPVIFGAEDRYFAHILLNDPLHFVQRSYYKPDNESVLCIAQGPEIKQEMNWKLSFYMGPKEHQALVAVDSRLEELLDYGWLGFLCKPMLLFMKWINSYVHNFGLAILIFTLLIRLLLMPLSVRGTQGAKKAQEMQKKLQYIKQKYKDDKEAFEREQTELYKKYGLSGLGGLLGGGCLPILLQIPIFFAVNRVLTTSIELYQAPFLWISDLSAQDPYYLLPVLVAISMLLSTISVSDTQQRISGFVMAMVFGAFSVGFSAGLALYIAASTLLGALQMSVQKALKYD